MSACAHDADPSTGPVDKSEMVAIDLTETVHTEAAQPPSNGKAKSQPNGVHAVRPSSLRSSSLLPGRRRAGRRARIFV